MADNDDLYHVVQDSTGRLHDTSGEPCWCHPRLLQVCPFCNAKHTECVVCRGEGVIKPWSDDESEPIIYIHQEEPP